MTTATQQRTGYITKQYVPTVIQTMKSQHRNIQEGQWNRNQSLQEECTFKNSVFNEGRILNIWGKNVILSIEFMGLTSWKPKRQS